MMPSERQQKIVELLSEKDFVSIPDLSAHFGMSIETIRRDLSILVEQDKIKKVYGGVRIRETHFGEPAMEARMNTGLEQKETIAGYCCSLIQDGECIFIDSGTTTYHISRLLKNRKNLTVMTNSIPVVNELMHTEIEIILIGGKIRHDELSVVSFNYLFNFSELNIQKAFIGAGGVSIANGISDYNMLEAVTRKQIIERSRQVIVAADSTKIGKDVTVKIAPLDAIDMLVTDKGVSSDFVQEMKQEKCGLMVV